MDNGLLVISDSEEEELLKRDSDEDKYSDVVSEDDRLLNKTPDSHIAQNVYFDETADDLNQRSGFSSRTEKGNIIDNIQSLDARCVNVLLIGKAGSGKSTAGNNISGEENFKVAPNAQLVTTKCQEAKVRINNVPINVVDTPGLFNLKIDNSCIQAMIGEHLIANPNLFPLIFILCIQDGVRFTKEDESVLKSIKDIFGTHVLQNLIVVFTGTMPTVDMPEVLEQFLKEIGNITFHFPTDSRSTEREIERALFVETCQKLLTKPENLNYNLSDYEAQRRIDEMKDVRNFRRLQPLQNSPNLSSLIRQRKRKKKYKSIHTSRKT